MKSWELPRPGLFRHFRNRQLYRLLFIARRSEEEGEFDCIYLPLYEESYTAPAHVMSRPAGMWSEMVDYPADFRAIGTLSDGQPYGPRFIRVGD